MRFALLILPFAGVALLVAAELSTLYEVRVSDSVPPGASSSAGAHHGYALALVAIAAAAMAVGAVRGGSRPAAVALAVLGVAAIAIALLADRPVTDDTGLYGEAYDAARAEAGPAVLLELLGGGALLAGACVMLLSAPRARDAGPPTARARRDAGRSA